MAAGSAGRLVLVATPIGNLGDLAPRAVAALRDADVIACEDTRHSRKLLDHAGIEPKRLLAVHAHNEAESAARLVDDMTRAGVTVAFVTDAGTPGISDPGERLVAAALAAGLPVDLVPGPSAVIAALVLSGLPTGRFCFEGFLPRKGRERQAVLGAIAAEPRTTVLYEAPHRLAPTVADLRDACGPERRMAIARELTKKFEDVWRGTLADAAERATTMEARGEHVLVVEGAPEPPAASSDDVDAAIVRRLDAGLSARDAAAEVARDLGVPKRVAYHAAVRLSRR
ncbi:MAG TPA: 16S rRNA (cytidine(1402)-2'-O)-methyltransferase [Acidimicrobiales bacterium]|nr:16S rRNA (cytidine(1402)-2'-O)-methyltransferase [Acidimicrobiales bacterium]